MSLATILVNTDHIRIWHHDDKLGTHGDSHYKDKTVSRPSYLYNGNPYI